MRRQVLHDPQPTFGSTLQLSAAAIATAVERLPDPLGPSKSQAPGTSCAAICALSAPVERD